ncbi:MAG: hypothetical protein COA84_14165 [Robiginitomaculum sp.]|nr:MAG: hypothetical protein COA84_14165 [Robiginitomaculum sp.]
MTVNAIHIKNKSGLEATFSLIGDLIMLHSHDVSAQWSPEFVGVEVCNNVNSVKVAFHNITKITDVSPQHHQSFYFKVDEYEKILAWFKSLGFPCPQYERIHAQSGES